ncbi:hypothetical protein COK00_12020 [Bacillus cereus]|uniref:hypothetical protein n=1 Tax=Bacillus cereus TaxID=1396 RepID=UPI000BF7DCC1|nr:hypothetical protein [Bacillus cereus]PFP65319.1 hypothetical protein COK00_12020 [Bacillus cereus]
MSVLQYRIANNLSEYMAICKSTYLEETKDNAYSLQKTAPLNNFDEWVDFFGAWELRHIDDDADVEQALRDFNGRIDLKPDEKEYPVLVTFNFNEGGDRYGKVSSVVWDWTPINKLTSPSNRTPLQLLVECVKTLQDVRFICDRAKAHYVEDKDIEDILELLKGKV